MTTEDTNAGAAGSHLDRRVGRLEPERAVDWDAVLVHVFRMNGPPKLWRSVRLCATVPWRKAKRGKRARKAAFAHSARRCRAWMADYKRQALASGAYYLPPNAELSR